MVDGTNPEIYRSEVLDILRYEDNSICSQGLPDLNLQKSDHSVYKQVKWTLLNVLFVYHLFTGIFVNFHDSYS